jgi:DNA-binding CsgD family transcriptional regulator
MAEADIAERARAGRDRAGAAEAEARLAALRERLDRARASVDLPRGPDLEVRGHSAMIAAEHARASGSADPAAWRRAVDLFVQWREPYLVAYARYRLAEALLSGREGRAEAGDELRIARELAVGLGARPMIERIEGLATRARLPLGAAKGEAAAEAADVGTETVDRADPLAVYDLTPREVEVLRLLAAGRTNRQIAEELFISESTAGVHVSHIMGKLDVSGRVEAATIATRLGLLD